MRAWLASESAWVPQPTERHGDLLGEFLALPGVHGNLVPDAHLAALAVEHGLTLCSTDGDFARFQGLRWLNPISSCTNYQIDCAFDEHPPMRSTAANGGPVRHNEFILKLSSLAGHVSNVRSRSKICTAHRASPSGGPDARRFHWTGIA